MVFENYLLPVMPNHTKSILDYDVQIRNLRPEATFFVPAETGTYIYRVSNMEIRWRLKSEFFLAIDQ